jgi:predicted ArsR family transcriptional regulator
MQDRASDRLLYALKSGGPQTAASLALTLKVTSVAVRQSLERLAGEGLVTHEDRRVSVGRPKRHWMLTEAGHQRFPDRHAVLTLDLIEATSTVFGAEGLDRLIAHREGQMLASYGAALAGLPLREKVEKLAEMRSTEGYMAEAVEDDEGLLLVENHCPICIAATRCQNFCRSERNIFASVLGPEVTVTRIDHIVAGARRCAYRISPVAEARKRA